MTTNEVNISSEVLSKWLYIHSDLSSINATIECGDCVEDDYIFYTGPHDKTTWMTCAVQHLEKYHPGYKEEL